jgi:uncharacterized protein (TIGR02678 family)
VTGDPQAAAELRAAARHVLAHPLTCKEHDADVFRLIRRHEGELDRWFTQRLGYRLHTGADTARLFKTAVVPERRPLRTASGRPFHQLEYVVLVLALASTVAGPAVVSLRDLVSQIRTAAAEAGVPLTGDATERRATVAALRWMVHRGLATELHAQVDAYANDAEADAVLALRPDRIALLPLPALGGFDDADDLLARANRREPTRQWLRARLVEDPVVYRDDVTDAEWIELRRRVSEEERFLDEMFGLVVEARGEGIAAVDPTGALSGRPFPTGGTVGHAALLLIETLRAEPEPGRWRPLDDVVACMTTLAAEHAGHWAGEFVDAPERLTRTVLDLLVEVRLAERREAGTGRTGGAGGGAPPAGPGAEDVAEVPEAVDVPEVRLLSAAGRFGTKARSEPGDGEDEPQAALW